MDFKNIRLLAKILNDSGLTAIEVDGEGGKIRLEKNIAYHTPVVREVVSDIAIDKPASAPVVAPAPLPTIDFNKIIEVKAPMIGVFYGASSPDSAPFVAIGSRIRKGDTLCIIEAMKVMNEIVAEHDGEIVDICVQNGQVVEFSQVMFKVF